MSLKNRLDLLQQQSGACPAAPPEAGATAPNGTALHDRLARLGAIPREAQARRQLSDEEAAQVLGGSLIAAGLVLVEEVFPLDATHGDESLSGIRQAPLKLLAAGSEVDPARLLFLDTETTGLAGGTGTMAFLLGLGRIEQDTLRVRQYFLTGFKGEAALLQEAGDWYQQAEHLVTFNGKRFDLPLLSTRYRLARLGTPFGHLGHIDLLYPTRSAFSRNWPDCRLQTAEQRLLKFLRTDDLPGYLVPQAWFDFVRLGETRQVRGILEHNRWDIVSLAALASALARVYASAEHAEADVLGIARACRRSGDEQQARQHLHTGQARLDQRGLLELAAVYRRKGDWEAAVAVWERLAAEGAAEALENLAKYHEHVRRDYRKALSLTRRLLERERGNPLHVQREQRLLARLGRAEDMFGCGDLG